MRRLDGIERIAAEAEGRPHRDDVAWMFARIRRLEAALKAATRNHEGSEDEPWDSCPASLFRDRRGIGPCGCGADAHNAAIDAALDEDG